MNFLSLLDAAAPTTDAPAGGGSIWGTLLMVVAVVAVFFFMSRSQKKQEREAANMRSSLTVGDEITTIGGIIGRIVKVTEETIVIETGKDRTKLHMLKSAVRSVDVHAADTIETAEKAAKKANQPENTNK